MTRTSDDQEIPGCEGCERLRAERDEALRIDRENREAYSVDRAEYAHNEARVYRENAKLRAALEEVGAIASRFARSMIDASKRNRAPVLDLRDVYRLRALLAPTPATSEPCDGSGWLSSTADANGGRAPDDEDFVNPPCPGCRACEPCPECHGEGEIDTDVQDVAGMRECGDCDGTGRDGGAR